MPIAERRPVGQNVLQLRYKGVVMKSATFPSVRVDPELRVAAEQILQDGESLSSFVEQSIRDGIERRQIQREFIARGLHSRDDARRKDAYLSSDAVIGRLEKMLACAKNSDDPAKPPA